MITRQELGSYIHQLLACDNFNDYAPNGLQVEGNEKISSICTAVTASIQVIKEASKLKAHALLVHHGYFWRGEGTVITGMKHTRIANLIQHNINLFGYHLPLDCHKELGNNARLGELFNLHSISSHDAGKTRDLIWSGQLAESINLEQFTHFLADKLGRNPLAIAGHDRPIKRIAWCSGAAQDYIENAYELGVDAYISGEVSERTYYQAKELGVHYFSCGHHATERYGIQALGQHLANHFGLEHTFLDTDNPI